MARNIYEAVFLYESFEAQCTEEHGLVTLYPTIALYVK